MRVGLPERKRLGRPSQKATRTARESHDRNAPFHPLLVHFPVALLPVSVACDVLGRCTSRAPFSHATWWTLLFATLASPLTAASGWVWLNDMDGMTGTTIAVHKWLGTALPVLLIALTVWRYRLQATERVAPVGYLVAATAVLLAMIVQGHLGATMTFGSSESQMQSPVTSQPASPEMPATQAPHSPEQSATSQATTVPASDGWQDSIRLKEHRHE